jgi:hypothetical protein
MTVESHKILTCDKSPVYSLKQTGVCYSDDSLIEAVDTVESGDTSLSCGSLILQ